jgi:hypothetical protein
MVANFVWSIERPDGLLRRAGLPSTAALAVMLVLWSRWLDPGVTPAARGQIKLCEPAIFKWLTV